MAFLDRLFRRDEMDEEEYGYEDEMQTESYQQEPQLADQPARRQSNRVVDIKSGSRQAQHEVVLLSPTDFGMTWQICDYVREGKTVICNIEGVQSDFRQRFVDFINGAAYALGGVIRPISKLIFLFAPKSTTISVPEVVEEMEERLPFEREPSAYEAPGIRSSERYMRQPRPIRTSYR